MPPINRTLVESTPSDDDGEFNDLLDQLSDNLSDGPEYVGATPATDNSSRAPSLEPNPGNAAAGPARAARRHFFELPANFRPAAAGPPPRIPDAPPMPRGGPAAPAAEAGPARGHPRSRIIDGDGMGAPGSSAHNAISLESSDEEDAPIAGPAVAPPRQRRVMSPSEFRNHMDALDRSLDRASRFERRARRQQDRERQSAENAADRLNRQVRSPQPEAGPAEPRRNRLGGAALRRGNAQYHFRPDRAPEVRFRDRDGNVRVREGLDPATGEEPLPLDHGLERLFGGIRGNPAILRNLLHGAFHLGIGAAGPAGQLDSKAILESVKAETPPLAADGFARTWDAEDLTKGIEEKEQRAVVLEIDERGRIVPDPSKRKPRGQVYLACSACPEPLRLGSANRSPEDRVWALRCGHLLDQRCYALYSQPGAEVPVLDAPATKRRRSGRATRSTRPVKKQEHEWTCPVKGCGCEHVSVMVDEAWAPMEGLGGVQLYV